MTDIPKALAANLDVDRSVRLTGTEWSTEGWRAHSESGEIYESDILILTAPVPQSVDLLRGSGISLSQEDWDGLCGIDYDPCLSGLLILDGPSGIPEPGAMKLQEGCLVWIGDNSRKGISPDVSAVTVHSTPDFARRYWDAPNEERLPLLQQAAEPYLSAKIVSGAVHRWRFNLPLSFWKSDFFWDESCSLGLAGDAFGGARVEAAALSGWALGSHLSG